MDLNPEAYRPLLLELIYTTTKVTRFYDARVLRSPIYMPAPGWSRLSRSAEQTAEHARRILAADEIEPKHRTLDLDMPLPAIRDRLAENIAARRALQEMPTPPRSRPRIH